MSKPPLKAPLTLKEARALVLSHGVEVLRDFARADPNPNSPAQEQLDIIMRNREEEAHRLPSAPPLPPPEPQTVGLWRRQGVRKLRVKCARCWHEDVIELSRIPAKYDTWAVKSVPFTHAKCPSKMLRISPLNAWEDGRIEPKYKPAEDLDDTSGIGGADERS